MRKVIIILLLCIILVTGCTKGENTINSSRKEMIDKILSENNYVIVDVRTEDEYNSGHIKGAVNIPYDTINKYTELDKSKTIFVYCKSGARSSKAYLTLKNLKYDVVNLGSYDNAKKYLIN